MRLKADAMSQPFLASAQPGRRAEGSAPCLGRFSTLRFGLGGGGNLNIFRTMNRICLVLGVALVASSRLPAVDFMAGYAGIVAAKGKTNDTERLHQLFQLDWDYRMHQSPESATHNGYPGLDHL